MRRIAIIGCAGAGKSTLARRIGDLLGIEVIHLDRHFWKPGWIETPREEWIEVQRKLLGGDAWVADGNYGATMDLRLEAADTILFLDPPRRTCLLRVLRRRVRFHGRSRPDIAPGCPEQIDLAFLRWIWAFPKRSRPAILERLERFGPGRRVEVLRNAREIERFLGALAEAPPGRTPGGFTRS